MIFIYPEVKNKILSISIIEDVIGEFVKLKKVGENYRGFSPFSNEKNPSFIVSPIKKIWKDFSSGKGGDLINFLMEHEKFTYIESLYFLAKKYNIKINFFNKKKNHNNTKEKLINKLYCIQYNYKCLFINKMFYSKEGLENGLNYLIKKRKFNINTIRKFELGYSPRGKITEEFLKKGFKLKDLVYSGNTIFINNRNFFDCFRKRIMFPIFNLNGKVIGFGGRSINNHDYSCSNKIKYINSSDSVIFKKSCILYGLYQAKKYILKNNLCYLVEGYTDVISLYQIGINNVVSTSGIFLTISQILLIKKFTSNIIIFYDGDSTGIKATLRIINLILEQDINLRIIYFSNGEDPDTISKKFKSLNELKKYLSENIYNFISFKYKIYRYLYKDDPIKKSFLVKNILISISKISNVVKRELYLQEASKILYISKEILLYELKKFYIKVNNTSYNNTYNSIENNLSKTKETKFNKYHIFFLEKKLIELILLYGNKKIKKNKQDTTVLKEIIRVFKYCKMNFFSSKNKKIFEKICSKKKILYISKIKKFYISEYKLSKWENKGIKVPSMEENIEKYLNDILLRYKYIHISKLIKKEILCYNNNNEKKILKKIILLTSIKNKIQKKLHRYV